MHHSPTTKTGISISKHIKKINSPYDTIWKPKANSNEKFMKSIVEADRSQEKLSHNVTVRKGASI